MLVNVCSRNAVGYGRSPGEYGRSPNEIGRKAVSK